MGIVVYVLLVLVLPLRALVGRMSVLDRRTIVHMRVGRHQALNRPRVAALSVVRDMDTLVLVDSGVVRVRLKIPACHLGCSSS